MGTTANQKKLFFNLRKAKSQISAFEEGDLRPENVQAIATKLGVSHQEVIDMNRRLGGDASLNAPLREEGEGEWQDWLVDTSSSQESLLVESEEATNRRAALSQALGVLNDRERRIFEARRLSDDPITLEDSVDRIRHFTRKGSADRGARLREDTAGGARPRRPRREPAAPAPASGGAGQGLRSHVRRQSNSAPARCVDHPPGDGEADDARQHQPRPQSPDSRAEKTSMSAPKATGSPEQAFPAAASAIRARSIFATEPPPRRCCA